MRGRTWFAETDFQRFKLTTSGTMKEPGTYYAAAITVECESQAIVMRRRNQTPNWMTIYCGILQDACTPAVPSCRFLS